MKVIPGMYADNSGVSCQLVLSGHRQYRVVWLYGENHVTVTFFDGHESPEKGWQELKRVSIPGDYKGKPWREIAKGMDEHLKVVCGGLVRQWEGDSTLVMDVFRMEWARQYWTERQKVEYDTVRAGTVKGVVVGHGPRGGTERVVKVRVTSRKNPVYPQGHVMEVRTNSPWLRSREV